MRCQKLRTCPHRRPKIDDAEESFGQNQHEAYLDDLMNDLQATLALVALFALRCIAPLAITLVIGYLLNRLVERWQAEDEAALATAGERVFQDQDVGVATEPTIRLPVITVPCWILRNCKPVEQADCPARKQPGLPCWLVRMTSDGCLPHDCPDCPIYREAMATVVTS